MAEGRPKAPAGPPPPWLKKNASQDAKTGAQRPRPGGAEALPKAKIAKSAPSRPKPAAPAPEPAVSPASPLSDGGPAWREFSEVDPVYALLGELADNKIYNSDGILLSEVLEEYVERLVQPGVVEKLKSWVEVWAAMNIPATVEAQVPIVQTILQRGLDSQVSSTIPDVLAELIKGHRVKVKAVEEAIQTLFECGDDEQGCLSRLLLLIFPKSPTSEWGWFRAGWNWQQWWSTSERILSTLDEKSAYEALCVLLRNIETDSGTYLPHQQIWDEKRLAVVRAALCRYSGVSEDELKNSFDVCLE